MAYVLNALTATCCPRYSRFHTSPNPPRYSATPVGLSDNSIRSNLGSRKWPAHALYNDFTHFFRISGARLRFSETYQGSEGQRQRQLVHSSGVEEQKRTSWTTSIKVWASLSWRQPTRSIALLLEKTASMSDASSP